MSYQPTSPAADPYLPPTHDGYEILRQVLPAGAAFTGVEPRLADELVAPSIITDLKVKTNSSSPIDPRVNTFGFKLTRQLMGWPLNSIDKGGVFRLGHRRTPMRLARVVGRVSPAATWALELKSPQWDGSVITTVLATSAAYADNPFLILRPVPTLIMRPEEYLVFTCAAGADPSWIEVHIDTAID
jgi:hypothetical protein